MTFRTFESRTLTCMGCGTTQRVRVELVETGEVFPHCESCGSEQYMDLPRLEELTFEDVVAVRIEGQIESGELVRTPWGPMTKEQLREQAIAYNSWERALREAMREVDGDL